MLTRSRSRALSLSPGMIRTDYHQDMHVVSACEEKLQSIGQMRAGALLVEVLGRASCRAVLFGLIHDRMNPKGMWFSNTSNRWVDEILQKERQTSVLSGRQLNAKERHGWVFSGHLDAWIAFALNYTRGRSISGRAGNFTGSLKTMNTSFMTYLGAHKAWQIRFSSNVV